MYVLVHCTTAVVVVQSDADSDAKLMAAPEVALPWRPGGGYLPTPALPTSGRTPLHTACAIGRLDLVEIILGTSGMKSRHGSVQ